MHTIKVYHFVDAEIIMVVVFDLKEATILYSERYEVAPNMTKRDLDKWQRAIAENHYGIKDICIERIIAEK